MTDQAAAPNLQQPVAKDLNITAANLYVNEVNQNKIREDLALKWNLNGPNYMFNWYVTIGAQKITK